MSSAGEGEACRLFLLRDLGDFAGQRHSVHPARNYARVASLGSFPQRALRQMSSVGSKNEDLTALFPGKVLHDVLPEKT